MKLAKSCLTSLDSLFNFSSLKYLLSLKGVNILLITSLAKEPSSCDKNKGEYILTESDIISSKAPNIVLSNNLSILPKKGFCFSFCIL